MHRIWVLTVVVTVAGCSDDDRNKTTPDTALLEVPPAVSNEKHVRIVFEARGNANMFFCTLDNNEPAPCLSPYEADVSDGEHTFEVAAALNANVDESPATHAWRIDTGLPDTTITSAPPTLDNATMPQFTFTGTDGVGGLGGEAPEDTARAAGDVTFECSLDGGAFGACSSPHTVTNVIDGVHSFAVRAKDEAGNVDPTPAMHGWTLDSTAPETMISAGPAAGATSGPNGSFAFGSPDSPVTFECSMDGAAFVLCTSPVAFSLTDGQHTFAVRAKDGTGIVDPSPATRMWNVDATPPPVTITATPTNPSNQTTPMFSFTSTDATATFECQIDGVVAFVACTSPWTAPAVTDGSRTFRVRATDPFANVGTAATFGWVVDTVAPTVSLTAQPSALSNDNTPSVSFTTAGSPVTVECGIDGAGFTACTSTFTSGALGDGMHTITVRATDAAGNQGSATTSPFVIDTMPPTVTINTQPAALSNDTTPTVTFTTAGNPSTIQCQVDSGSFANCTSGFTPTVGEGTHTITVRVTDAAGNFSSASTNMFVVDTTPPTVAINTQPAALSNDTTPTVTFTTGGNPTSTQCQVDSGAFASCSSPFTPTVADGTHTITVRVTDAASNSATATTNSFVVDTVAPTVTINTQPATLSNDTTPTVTFTTAGNPTATDCQVDAGAFTSCSSPFTPTVAEGTHTITVRVTDGASNSSSATTNMFTVDVTPPTVNITGAPAALSNDNTPTVVFTTAGSPATVQCRVDTGALVACTSPHTFGVTADGAHTITVIATDGAGNAGSATTGSFTIDTVGPVVAFTEQAPANWPVNYFDFRFSVGDSVTVECSLDGAAFAPCTSPHTVTVAYAVSHQLRVRGTDNASNATTVASTTWLPQRGLVLHYPWEQGDTDNTSLLKQVATHSPDGITQTISAFVGGWAGSALGSTVSAHQYAGTNRPLNSAPDGNYAASFWIRSTDAASATNIFTTANGTAGGLRVSLTGGSSLAFTAFEGGTSVTNSTIISEDRWVHVGMRTTGPGKGLEVFIDGNSRFALPNISGFNAGQAANMTVGAWQQLDVDDLRFYNQSFSNAEMCTVLARGTFIVGGPCVPLSPGFEIDFELGRIVDTGIWGMALNIAPAAASDFQTGTLGSMFRLLTATLWGYDTSNQPTTFQGRVSAITNGRSFTLSFVAGATFGRLIDFTRPCLPTGGGGLCGIAVFYADNNSLQIYSGTPTEQKTTTLTSTTGLRSGRFNNLVVTEQRNAQGQTTSLTVFLNMVKTTIPISGGDIYAVVDTRVDLVGTAGLLVDEYEFWTNDLQTNLEMLCENGADGEFDVVTNSCLLTAGP